MGTVDDQIARDLGIDREHLQGLCALWIMGADPRVMAAELGVSATLLTWYLFMARKTDLDDLGEHTVHFKHPNSSTN